jgi:hypothetical protein
MVSTTLNNPGADELAEMDLDILFQDPMKVEMLMGFIPEMRTQFTQSDNSLLSIIGNHDGDFELIVDPKIDFLKEMEKEAGFNSSDPDDVRVLRMVKLFLALELSLDEAINSSEIGRS